MDKIDLVVPYVDSLDKEWQKLFLKYNNSTVTSEETNSPVRFRGQGDFFKYFFRCIDQNMPWINNIFLIVQSETQVPQWLNKNTIKIVKHSDFIPEQFLPTFNSTTIEMFLWNIKELSEKFLYANDDTFIIQPVLPEHFYFNNKIPVSWALQTIGFDTVFGQHKINAWAMLEGVKKEDWIKTHKVVIGMTHQIRPYLKSSMIECYNKYKAQIDASITPFRTNNNMNVYLYNYYDMQQHRFLLSKTIVSTCIYGKTPSNAIYSILMSNSYNSLCIQDNDENINIYENELLNSIFKLRFSDISKYEL